MVEACGYLDLTKEALTTDCRGEFGPHHFHRHLAVVFEVFREVDGSHTARTDLPLDGVAVGEGGLEAVEEVWHYVLAPLATVLE